MRLTLKNKLNITIAATVVFIAVVSTAVLTDLNNKRIATTIENVTLLLETLVQRDLEPLANELFEGRIRALDLRINQILEVPGMLEVSIFDASGQLLVSTHQPERSGVNKLPAEDLIKVQNSAFTRRTQWQDTSALYFARDIRIIGTSLGVIALTYSLQEVETALAAAHRNILLLISGILVVMVIVLNLSMIRTIIHPIHDLRDAIDEMRRGDFSHRVAITSNDEIGELGTAFNHMSDQLAASYEEIDAKNSELRERNAALRNEIADRRKAEQEAKRLQQRLTSVFDSMPSILVSVTPEGVVNQWNRRATDDTGLSPMQAIGSPLADVLPRLAPEMSNVLAAINEGSPYVMRRRPHTVDGEECYEDVAIYPLLSSREAGAVIRVDDVTDRVRIEEMMIQTEKMLSVGGLAAGMAHEINNPLGAILQGVQNVERRLSPDLPANIRAADESGTTLDTVREYMERRKIFRMLTGIRDAGKRAARIVSNMLDFSRKSESRMLPTRLEDIVADTIELAANDYDMKKKYDFRKVDIVREHADGLPDVVCIRTEIEQVLLNILRNATQAMAIHGTNGAPPQITVRTKKERTMAVIEIEDNGPGMDAAMQKRIFEPFYTTKPPGVGTGLGLSVSYFIITQNHGGEFHVRSEPGHGACFIIRLPLGERQTGEGNLAHRA